MIKALTSHNTTWITGTPRTGSMWTKNVTREIFRMAGYKVLPEKYSKYDEDCFEKYINSSLQDASSYNRYVFKTHIALKLDLARSKYIVNIRNPYEVCTSFYQFMKCDLEKAIDIGLSLSNTIDYYSQISNDNLLKIRYEDLESYPINIIKKIASFVEIELQEDMYELISNKFSKKQVQSIIKECETNISKKLNETGKASKDEIVIISPKFIRAFDVHTGFQSGHIAPRRSSEWRKIFSQPEIDKIINLIDDKAIELGYKSEKNDMLL